LFTFKHPIPYIKPLVSQKQFKTSSISGISDLLNIASSHSNEFKNYSNNYIDKDKLYKLKQLQDYDKLQYHLSNYNPDLDLNIVGDPYKTIFVGRLPYNTNELKLSSIFNQFGEIDSIKLITDKYTNKSKGYAFIVYKTIESAKLAYQKGNGLKIDDDSERKCIVDYERGRIVKNWKPRRLGGGLGGR
ncbi:hypothetical protein CANARDRAFT_180284, partial [[Candida] arabinofermentans NRRL YB-2248]